MNEYEKLRADFPVLFERVSFEVGPGWLPMIRELAEKITAIDPICQASQVKEKYGTLRFYMDTACDAVYYLIDEYEAISERTCEECGAPGTIGGKGWITTRCKGCRNDGKT